MKSQKKENKEWKTKIKNKKIFLKKLNYFVSGSLNELITFSGFSEMDDVLKFFNHSTDLIF